MTVDASPENAGNYRPLQLGSPLNDPIHAAGQVAAARPIASVARADNSKVIQAVRSARPPRPAPMFVPIRMPAGPPILSQADRDVLNIALGKYQPAKSEPMLVGGARLLKPALRLLTLIVCGSAR